MMRETTTMMLGAGVACVILSTAAAAQTPRSGNEAQTIGRGWAALAAGRSGEAVLLADGVLKRRPRYHAALSLKIEALSSGGQPLAALDAYEAWLSKANANVDDRGLLEPIATGILRALVTDPDPLVRSAALRFLGQSGDESAAQALRKASDDGDQTATIALASSGDPAAVAALQTLVGVGTGRDASAAIAALADHGGLPPGLMATIIKDRVPMNRAAAARALARSTDLNAARQLEELSSDPDPVVRISATLARAVRGDAKALADSRAMLASEVPDVRLIAAEALSTTLPAESEEAVRSLLTNRDGVNRFRAAAIVAKTDPAAIQSILLEGLADPNPLIQQQAAGLVTGTFKADLGTLRKLLRHRDRSIVANAAGAILGD